MMSYMTNASVTDILAYRVGETDKERIEHVLRIGDGLWVCGSAFLEAYMPTYSQRISEMRRAGLPIETGACRNEHHDHRSRIGAYRWTRTEPEENQSAWTM